MWWGVLDDLNLTPCKLPRDVRTRWNSMFRMLDVALEYHAAVAWMTESQANNLRQWELSDREWKIAMQLRDVLQVSHSVTLWVHSLLIVCVQHRLNWACPQPMTRPRLTRSHGHTLSLCSTPAAVLCPHAGFTSPSTAAKHSTCHLTHMTPWHP